jgi:hypothetical protein
LSAYLSRTPKLTNMVDCPQNSTLLVARTRVR